MDGCVCVCVCVRVRVYSCILCMMYACLHACTRARVCVCLPGTWEQMVTPLILFSTINKTVNNIFAGGRRVCRGAPSNEALPCAPGKRTCIACAWAPSWAAGGALIFVHLSSHFVLRHSLVSGAARGRNLTLYGSSHSVLFCMPFLRSGVLGTKTFISFSFFIIIIIHIILQLASFFAFALLFSSLLFCRIRQCDSAWVMRLQSSGFPSWRRGDPSWATGDEPDMFRFLFS